MKRLIFSKRRQIEEYGEILNLKRFFGSVLVWSLEEKEGLICRRDDGTPFTGLLKSDTRYPYLYGQISSDLIDHYKTSEIYFLDGLKHGISRVYFLNRRLLDQGKKPRLIEDEKIKEVLEEECFFKYGKINGYRKLYDPQGFLIKKEQYKDGVLNGPVYEYSEPSGLEVMRGYYVDGVLSPYVEKYSDGKVYLEKSWKEGEDGFLYRSGVWRVFTKQDGEYYKVREESYDDLGREIETKTYNHKKEILSSGVGLRYETQITGSLKSIRKTNFETNEKSIEEYWSLPNNEYYQSPTHNPLRLRSFLDKEGNYFNEVFWKDGRRMLTSSKSSEDPEFKVVLFDPLTGLEEIFYKETEYHHTLLYGDSRWEESSGITE